MKQVNFTDAVGKTIKKVGLNCHEAVLVVVYSDETFSAIEGGKSYEGDINFREDDFLYMHGSIDPVEFGFITQEEFDRINAEEDEKRKKRLEQDERYTYERLKAKFG